MTSVLAKWLGPGRLVVKDVQGKNRELKPGDTCRVSAIHPAQAQRGLREVGAQAAGNIETDVTGERIRELKMELVAQLEVQDCLRCEIAALCDQRDALQQQVTEDTAQIALLAAEVKLRDKRLTVLQAQLSAAEVVDKPWLEETVEALTALVGRLGGKLKSPKRADLLAWLYTQPQRSVAEAYAQREVEGE